MVNRLLSSQQLQHQHTLCVSCTSRRLHARERTSNRQQGIFFVDWNLANFNIERRGPLNLEEYPNICVDKEIEDASIPMEEA